VRILVIEKNIFKVKVFLLKVVTIINVMGSRNQGVKNHILLRSKVMRARMKVPIG
jgi:hypothetical protein